MYVSEVPERGFLEGASAGFNAACFPASVPSAAVSSMVSSQQSAISSQQLAPCNTPGRPCGRLPACCLMWCLDVLGKFSNIANHDESIGLILSTLLFLG